MATQNTGSTTGNTGKSKRKPKPMSDARKLAENAVELACKTVEGAKSPQEIKAAESHLKLVRDNLKTIKFNEIVPPRVTRVVNQLNTLAKMANRSAYKWTPEQADKIVKALEAKTSALKSKLTAAAGSGAVKETFQF